MLLRAMAIPPSATPPACEPLVSSWQRLLVAALAVVILVSSWGSWGEADPRRADFDRVHEGVQDALEQGVRDGVAEVGEFVDAALDTDLLHAPRVTVDLSGWEGRISARGFEAPNALAILAGVLMGLLAITPSRGRWPSILALQLAIYGSFHLGVLTIDLSEQSGMRPAGWATLGAFLLSTIVLLSGVAAWRAELAQRGWGRTVQSRLGDALGLGAERPSHLPAKGKSKGNGKNKAGRRLKAEVPSPRFSRACAYALDILLIGLWLGVLTLLMPQLPAPWLEGVWNDPMRAQLVILAALLAPIILVSSVFDSKWGMGTPGKRALHLRVGLAGVAGVQPLPFPRALLRNVLKYLPWELAHTALWRIEGWPDQVLEISGPPLLLLVGMWVLLAADVLCGWMRSDRRSLHDLLSGASVVLR